MNAFHAAFAVSIILSAIAALGGFLIHDKDAAATMAPRKQPVPEPIRQVIEEPEPAPV